MEPGGGCPPRSKNSAGLVPLPLAEPLGPVEPPPPPPPPPGPEGPPGGPPGGMATRGSMCPTRFANG
eukprot:3792531-Karenia_brevis.AAC.1